MIDPDLSDLSALVAVAETRNFRAAAKIRGVSASSLSDAIRRLEERLDVRLLNRTTRSVTPTEACVQLLERLTPAMGEIAGALDALNNFRNSPTGTLKLNVPVIVARSILPPIVNSFLLAHPGIVLDILASDTFIDILAAGFDAGIRYDESIERDMIAIPIGPRTQRFVLAAAPAYLAARGTPEHPRDIIDHDCIRHRFASGVTAAWEFEKNGQSVKIAPKGPLLGSHIELELGAAIAGLGLIYTFEEVIEPAFKTGELLPVMQPWWMSFTGPRLYYPSRNHMPVPLRAFVDFIKNNANRSLA
ncbi:LysR family transcriptional regulator [Phyllobacterium sp. SB3]|uniref:LysR family transcriptional regulator n=1 Tax=Phyllobacterium sp. SB3 TaxID=3156073 RepID=UPI0032AF7A13